MKLITLVLVVLATGCGYRAGSAYEVIIDSKADPVFADDVLTATDMWVSAVPVEMKTTISDRCSAGDGTICVHPVTHVQWLAFGPRGDAWASTKQAIGPLGREDGANIYVDVERVTPARLRVIIGHELGHAMGLDHTGAGTLMCAENSCTADHVTETDIQQWHAARR